MLFDPKLRDGTACGYITGFEGFFVTFLGKIPWIYNSALLLICGYKMVMLELINQLNLSCQR